MSVGSPLARVNCFTSGFEHESTDSLLLAALSMDCGLDGNSLMFAGLSVEAIRRMTDAQISDVAKVELEVAQRILRNGMTRYNGHKVLSDAEAVHHCNRFWIEGLTSDAARDNKAQIELPQHMIASRTVLSAVLPTRVLDVEAVPNASLSVGRMRISKELAVELQLCRAGEQPTTRDWSEYYTLTVYVQRGLLRWEVKDTQTVTEDNIVEVPSSWLDGEAPKAVELTSACQRSVRVQCKLGQRSVIVIPRSVSAILRPEETFFVAGEVSPFCRPQWPCCFLKVEATSIALVEPLPVAKIVVLSPMDTAALAAIRRDRDILRSRDILMQVYERRGISFGDVLVLNSERDPSPLVFCVKSVSHHSDVEDHQRQPECRRMCFTLPYHPRPPLVLDLDPMEDDLVKKTTKTIEFDGPVVRRFSPVLDDTHPYYLLSLRAMKRPGQVTMTIGDATDNTLCGKAFFCVCAPHTPMGGRERSNARSVVYRIGHGETIAVGLFPKDWRFPFKVEVTMAFTTLTPTVDAEAFVPSRMGLTFGSLGPLHTLCEVDTFIRESNAPRPDVTRILVIGGPQSGKSTLCNFLCGDICFPVGNSSPWQASSSGGRCGVLCRFIEHNHEVLGTEALPYKRAVLYEARPNDFSAMRTVIQSARDSPFVLMLVGKKNDELDDLVDRLSHQLSTPWVIWNRSVVRVLNSEDAQLHRARCGLRTLCGSLLGLHPYDREAQRIMKSLLADCEAMPLETVVTTQASLPSIHLDTAAIEMLTIYRDALKLDLGRPIPLRVPRVVPGQPTVVQVHPLQGQSWNPVTEKIVTNALLSMLPDGVVLGSAQAGTEAVLRICVVNASAPETPLEFTGQGRAVREV